MSTETTTLIKGRAVDPLYSPWRRVIKRAVHEAAQESQAMLRATEARRDEIVAAGRREGYTQGYAEWDLYLRQAAEAKAEMLKRAESEVVELAIKVAEKIVGQELTSNPAAIVSLVSEALESVKREREVNILVNPKHYPEVKKHMAVFAERLGANRLIQVFESADVPPGGCRIESELGKINADLKTQIDAIRDLFLRESKGRE